MLRLKNKTKTSQKLLIPFYHYVLIPDSFIVFYTIKIFTLSYFVVACTPSELFFLLIIISHPRVVSVTVWNERILSKFLFPIFQIH